MSVNSNPDQSGSVSQGPIPYVKPSITEMEITLVSDAIQNGWGEQCYDHIHALEREFADHLGVQHAIATSSCTGALHMGLSALGIGPGDQVILADTNWIASVAPIVHLGATPVFVDILPDSWCIDPDAVRSAITPKTRAIMAVHLYGNLCEMQALRKIADEEGLILIEDAAEALGSRYYGDAAGSMGTFGAFSFHGSKTMTTGEGGMFVTNDSALYETVLTLSNHGRARGQVKQFWADMIGFKYKMPNLSAALGRAQLQRMDSLIARKREILAHYKTLFSDYPELSMNPEPEGCINGAWMPNVVLDASLGLHRDELLRRFKTKNIDARVFFHPLSSLPMFEDFPRNEHAYSIAKRAVNLPSFHDMTDEQIHRVANIVIDTVKAHVKG